MGLAKGVVMDGRDIGTVVFPEAELKIFMTASLDVRVARRRIELEQAGGTAADEEDIRNNLEKRDWQDTHRAESPLRRAEDARLLDTTNLSFQQQVETILQWVTEILENQLADR